MKKETISNWPARTVKGVLNAVLRLEANTASSGIAYQPKVPAELSRFHKKR